MLTYPIIQTISKSRDLDMLQGGLGSDIYICSVCLAPFLSLFLPLCLSLSPFSPCSYCKDIYLKVHKIYMQSLMNDYEGKLLAKQIA